LVEASSDEQVGAECKTMSRLVEFPDSRKWRRIVKLSEAILRGSTILVPQPGGQYFPETKSGCALGMAAIARGCRFGTVTEPVKENDRRTLGVEGVWGQWVLRVVMRPCECWEFRVPPAMRIKDIIAHLFDFHVMKKKNWTLHQLAAWVETWEPKESSFMPSASALLPGKPISRQPRCERSPAVERWQQFRQAFEARRKAGQSSPEDIARA
jgi:hypothetical protein